MQADINQAAVEIAYTHYLDKFAEIAYLKIVGSYLHQPLSQETNTNGDEILYLLRPQSVFLQVQGQPDRGRQVAARVSGEEIGDDGLWFS